MSSTQNFQHFTNYPPYPAIGGYSNLGSVDWMADAPMPGPILDGGRVLLMNPPARCTELDEPPSPTLEEMQAASLALLEAENENKAAQRPNTVAVLPQTIAPVTEPRRTNCMPNKWATVYYYEEKERIGEAFEASTSRFYVDGYATHSDPLRLSINSLGGSKLPKRTTIRNQLGKGLVITLRDGKVRLRTFSGSAIFVQSPQRAELNGEMPNTVYRLRGDDKNNREIVIFDEEYFDKILNTRQQFVNNEYYMLHNHCVTRVSIVKGFGESYQRKRITQTPCWIEIHMDYKLRRFDEMVRNARRQAGCPATDT